MACRLRLIQTQKDHYIILIHYHWDYQTYCSRSKGGNPPPTIYQRIKADIIISPLHIAYVIPLLHIAYVIL